MEKFSLKNDPEYHTLFQLNIFMAVSYTCHLSAIVTMPQIGRDQIPSLCMIGSCTENPVEPPFHIEKHMEP